jgi:hypothetical protein
MILCPGQMAGALHNRAYNSAEGLVSIIAGFIAGSVSLVGFGLDSLIRGILSPFGENRLSAHRMRKVHHRPCGIAVLHVYHPVPSDE